LRESLEASRLASFLIKTLVVIFKRAETVTHITHILLRVSKLTQQDLSRERVYGPAEEDC
jgi:hypothetical protein